MGPCPARRAASEVDAVTETETYRELIERLRSRIREVQDTRRAHAQPRAGHALLVDRARHPRPEQGRPLGEDIVGRIAQDLAADSGSARGFSRRNLFYMRRFAATWPDSAQVQTLSAQIGWSDHQVLLDSFANQPEIYAWYAGKVGEHRWSVRQLKGQVDLQLYQRQGAALTNFERVLKAADAAPALQATKDPYVFDFLELSEDVRERQLEQALIDDIQKLLLELGTGFAFYGRQKPIVVGGEEFFLDLLFTTTRCGAS